MIKDLSVVKFAILIVPLFIISNVYLTGLQIIIDAIEKVGGIYLVTADHGNAEDMVKRNKSGEPLLKDGNIQVLTSHTLKPVRFRNCLLEMF